MGLFDVKFSFTRKGEEKPTPLQTIDEELCALLNQPVDEKWYVADWHDQFGIVVYNDSKNPFERWREKAKTDMVGNKSIEYAKWYSDRFEHTLVITKHLQTNYDVRIWY